MSKSEKYKDAIAQAFAYCLSDIGTPLENEHVNKKILLHWSKNFPKYFNDININEILDDLIEKLEKYYNSSEYKVVCMFDENTYNQIYLVKN